MITKSLALQSTPASGEELHRHRRQREQERGGGPHGHAQVPQDRVADFHDHASQVKVMAPALPACVKSI
jgi:hypothetical protein